MFIVSTPQGHMVVTDDDARAEDGGPEHALAVSRVLGRLAALRRLGVPVPPPGVWTSQDTGDGSVVPWRVGTDAEGGLWAVRGLPWDAELAASRGRPCSGCSGTGRDFGNHPCTRCTS